MSLRKKTRISENYFGQVVIGPPGSGKTTYCGKVYTFYKDKLNRKVEVVNLDPANENMNYKPNIDIMQLITVQDVMQNCHLGNISFIHKHNIAFIKYFLRSKRSFNVLHGIFRRKF